jgi:hypothetical protein
MAILADGRLIFSRLEIAASAATTSGSPDYFTNNFKIASKYSSASSRNSSSVRS